jgi:hypothetical protein
VVDITADSVVPVPRTNGTPGEPAGGFESRAADEDMPF